MVRLTLELRNHANNPEDAMNVTETFIDIKIGKQLDEEFLLNVNPKGQVSRLRLRLLL